MTNLNDIIKQAANDYLVRCKHYGSTGATPKDHFEAGIEYALKELLSSRCVGFAAWVQYERVRKGADGKWYFIGTYTKKVFAKDDAELWKKFEEKINDDSLKGFFDHISF